MPVNPLYSYPILLEEIKYITDKKNNAENRENFLYQDNKSRTDKITDSAKSSIVTQQYGDTLSLSAYALSLQQNAPASKIGDFKKIFNDKKQLQSVYHNSLINAAVIPSAMEEDSLSGNIGNGFYLGGPHTENISYPKLLTVTSESTNENIKQVYSGKNNKFRGTLVNLLF